jgi:hypothetical protein
LAIFVVEGSSVLIDIVIIVLLRLRDSGGVLFDVVVVVVFICLFNIEVSSSFSVILLSSSRKTPGYISGYATAASSC